MATVPAVLYFLSPTIMSKKLTDLTYAEHRELLWKNTECPLCGMTDRDNLWRNSSDELMCDSCGYSEAE